MSEFSRKIKEKEDTDAVIAVFASVTLNVFTVWALADTQTGRNTSRRNSCFIISTTS